MKEAGFFNLALNGSKSEKRSDEEYKREASACVRSILGKWPATVSEMTHDPSSPTGVIFRCLFAAGGIMSYPADFRNLTVGADAWPILCKIRAILFFLSTFIIAFGPVNVEDFTTEAQKERAIAIKRGEYKFEEYEKHIAGQEQCSIHGLPVLLGFILVPLLETVAILVSFLELANREFDITAATVYSVVQVVRLFLFYCVIQHISKMNPLVGSAIRALGGTTMHNYRCFKSEYTLLVALIQSQLLLGISSFIDVSVQWNDGPVFQTALYIIVAWHVLKIVPNQYKLLKAYVWNDKLEYTEEELFSIFNLWKEKELKVREMFEKENQGLKKIKEQIDKESEKDSDMKKVWHEASIRLENENGLHRAAPRSFRAIGRAIMFVNTITHKDSEAEILARSKAVQNERDLFKQQQQNTEKED